MDTVAMIKDKNRLYAIFLMVIGYSKDVKQLITTLTGNTTCVLYLVQIVANQKKLNS
jgi:hypothetical protein